MAGFSKMVNENLKGAGEEPQKTSKVQGSIIKRVRVEETPITESASTISEKTTPDKTTVLDQTDAEIAARLLRAQRISEATNVNIDLVLAELSKPTKLVIEEKKEVPKKKTVIFKKNDKGQIIGAEVIE